MDNEYKIALKIVRTILKMGLKGFNAFKASEVLTALYYKPLEVTLNDIIKH